MKNTKKYSTDSFDINALASLSKLSLSEQEAKSFLSDITDMANYTYERLQSESADGTLALCTCTAKTLDELRDDVCSDNTVAESILENAPDLIDRYIRVPKTVGKTEVKE
ncbi:MAG: hypothetical protein J6L85_07680 [Clostridia bacterium]|nr:hypothetical protein [Clostridia bacterium]